MSRPAATLAGRGSLPPLSNRTVLESQRARRITIDMIAMHMIRALYVSKALTTVEDQSTISEDCSHKTYRAKGFFQGQPCSTPIMTRLMLLGLDYILSQPLNKWGLATAHAG